MDVPPPASMVPEVVVVALEPNEQQVSVIASNCTDVAQFSIGAMSGRCTFCRASFFSGELTSRGHYKECCEEGAIVLEPLHPLPPYLDHLFRDRLHADCKRFREHVISYNYAFQFASVEANRRDIPGRGPYVYSIQGQILHHLSDVNLNSRGSIRYGPLYFLNPEVAAEMRLNLSDRLRSVFIRRIGEELAQVNPFARAYWHLREVFEQQREAAANGDLPLREVHLQLFSALSAQGQRVREYDEPSVRQVGIVSVVGDPNYVPDVALRVFVRDAPSRFRTLDLQSELCDPLTFPLLFPHGEPGWHYGLSRSRTRAVRNRITVADFYRYRLAFRDDESVFRHAGHLTQQYIVLAYVKIESNRLKFIRCNQNLIRAESYVGLSDYLHTYGEITGVPIGRMVILPSSFQGGNRSQHQFFLDAMAVVGRFGKPSLFITMTCNPNWPEIVDNIPLGDSPLNHPTLISRVFRLKLQELVSDLLERQVFGRPVAQLHVIEFQKRGLPHSHILLILSEQFRMLDPCRIDSVIRAELPDQKTEPALFDIVRRHMIHGPCDGHSSRAVCLIDGKCSKGFPREFREDTIVNENGGVLYRRRRNLPGQTITDPHLRRQNTEAQGIDNRWVVPYNPYLLLKFNSHINVEAVASVNSVKYLYKYLFKGQDRILAQITNADSRSNVDVHQAIEYDEITSFLNARYLSPPEAAWHICKFPLRYNTHTVVRLSFHLPGDQQVLFSSVNAADALRRAQNTQLTAWFALNGRDVNARAYLYAEIPLHYVWNGRVKQWHARRRGGDKVVTRLFNVSIRHRELYFLRVLLLHVRGATSFNFLKTVDDQLCESFEEACRRRNLLAEDMEWERCLSEAREHEMPYALRQLFSYVLLFCDVHSPLRLWEMFQDCLIEDFLRRDNMERQAALGKALRSIDSTLLLHGSSLENFGLPRPAPEAAQPDGMDDADLLESIMAVESDFAEVDRSVASLTSAQRGIFELIDHAVRVSDSAPRLFFLSGSGGVGKTFLYNTLIRYFRVQGHTVLATAWTGLAASLLLDGRTVHSLFKLPVPLCPTSSSSLRVSSTLGQLIARSKLIIWDEVSMATVQSLKLVEEAIRYVSGNNQNFAGKVILLGGDFKQCLPVVVNGDRHQVVAANVKNSPFWPLFHKLTLTTNLRAQHDPDFSRWLMQLGNNELPRLCEMGSSVRDLVEIPSRCIVRTKDALIDACFGHIEAGGDHHNTAILTPLNSDCFAINDRILERLPGDECVFFSVDSIVDIDEGEDANYPLEFLNTLTPCGMPQHRLSLKVGAVIVLLRNLDVRDGLCNGTRLIITRLAQFYLNAEVLSNNGERTGRHVLIPRIDLTIQDSNLPFSFKRRQFPVRLAYAMTINKAQGQTFERVGIYLSQPVFSHGQLYVAFSRAKSFSSVFMFMEQRPHQGRSVSSSKFFTRNIVYQEVLDQQ